MKQFRAKILLILILGFTSCTGGNQNSTTPSALPSTDNTSEVQSALQQTQAALAECEQQAASNAGIVLSAAVAISQSGSSSASGSTLGTAGVTPTTGTTTSGSCSSDITTAVELLLSAHDSSGQLAISNPSFISYLESFISTMFQAAGSGLSSTQQAQLVSSAWQLYQQVAPSLSTSAQTQLSSYISNLAASSAASSASSSTASLPAAPSGYAYVATLVTNSLGTSGYSYVLEPTSSISTTSGYSWATNTTTSGTSGSGTAGVTLSNITTSAHQSRANSALKIETQKMGTQGTINLVY